MIVPLNLLDSCYPLALHVLAYKLFEWTVILKDRFLPRLLVCAHRKEGKGLDGRIL
jgi:hypothetical protein